MRSFLNEIAKHFAVTIIYFALLAVTYGLINGWGWPVVFLCLGGLVGAELLDLDHLVYAFLTYRDISLSREVRRLAREGQFAAMFSYIEEQHKKFEPAHLLNHNCIMQSVFYVFTLCMVLCSSNLFWVGVGMSILLHLLKDEWDDFLNLPGRLRMYIFRHFPRIPLAAVRAYVIVATALFVLLTLLVILPSA